MNLENSKNKIIEIQTRPYISITEATVLFEISKDTLRRLIKNNILPAHNFRQRLTRITFRENVYSSRNIARKY
ncbi:helix-turn-helix domain-containing protein [Chryseobacterium populi]|uniref:helix-turn-helix domain-containing protein n=1 Tax=Chryseobacterium populi TaxID=1144316 RepID=UPI00373FE235